MTLFSASGGEAFAVVGIFIVLLFFIVEMIRRSMRGS